MPKTKEQIKAYNKAYFARPHVRARAKIRNAKYRQRRQEYKKTAKGKKAERNYRIKNKETLKARQEAWRLASRYGLTIDQFNQLRIEQAGLCKICGRVPKRVLHIDHDHSTGEVRGLICGPCNMALGLMKDEIRILRNAIRYLQGE